MFKCAITGKMSLPGEKVNRIVTKRRPKDYYEERYDEESDRYVRVKVGSGWEIEEEVFATDAGLKVWQQMQLIVRG